MNRLFTIYLHDEVLEFSDDDLPLTIGSGADANIRQAAGKAIEAHIADSRGHLFLQPASDATSVYHNDTRLSSSVWIKSGDSSRIAGNVFHFHLSGDRVEIRLSAAEETALTPPLAPPPGSPGNLSAEAEGNRKKLPRSSEESKCAPGGKKLRYLAGGIFLLLLTAAVFVLTARSVEVTVDPAPEEFSISGFPPVLKFGQRFLALKGEYTVQVSKQGYQNLIETISVKENGLNQFSLILEKLPGLVDMVSSPVAGVEIFIDDLFVGVTPLTGFEVPAGEHGLRLVKERYLALDQLIQVEGLGRKQQFEFVLQPAWGEVTLASDPDGAAVFAGETELGRTPVTVELPGGEHILTLRKEGFSAAEVELEVMAGGHHTLNKVALSPAPATVTVESVPTGAAVSVDGAFKGTTPVTLSLSPEEQHRISLSLSGHAEKKSLLTVEPGSSRELSFTLQPEYGIVFVTTEPPDAELLIDGKPHGRTTGRLRLTVRQHLLTVKARGYETASQTVSPSKANSQQVNIRLKSKGKAGGLQSAASKNKMATAGHKMIRLEPAVFTMGASRREPGRRANEQEHQVEITRPFYLAAREVTNDEFRRFKPEHQSGRVGGQSLDIGHQPVVMLSWEDAARYCNWISQQEGLSPFYREEKSTMVAVSPATNGYRLPFESEWAYAARVAGRKSPSRYPWEGTFPPKTTSGNYGDESARSILPMVIRNYNDKFMVTAPVASFPANQGGFFDMGGNVSEWCHDFYTPQSVSGAGGRIVDPTGPATGTHHVVRGSSWRDNTITELRFSYRAYSRSPGNDIGFRVARYGR